MFPRVGYSASFTSNDSLLIVNIEGVQATKQDEILDKYHDILKSNQNLTIINRYDAVYKLKLWFKEFPTYYDINHKQALKIKEETGANYLAFIKVLSKSGESPLYFKEANPYETNPYGRQAQSSHKAAKVKVGIVIYNVNTKNIIKVFELKTATKEILFEKSSKHKNSSHSFSFYDVNPLIMRSFQKNTSKLSRSFK